MKNAIQRAVEIAGGPTALARKLEEETGVKWLQSTVSNWLARGQVSVSCAIAVENITGVPRNELRPDIYPPAEAQEFTGSLGE